jgi:hypothetical protein
MDASLYRGGEIMNRPLTYSGPDYDNILAKAKEKSLTEEYKGCAIHINAWVMRSGSGFTVAFGMGDWYVSESTVCTIIDGKEKD